MIFIYKAWEQFCANLKELNLISIPACDVGKKQYFVLKHDVETNVASALQMAVIENKYGHRGSFYVQAYLLEERQNIEMLRKIQELGHEVSYHYDVLDSCKGNIELALAEFQKDKKSFEDNGFNIKTVCQHGNPVVERIGYTSNRDFFRNAKIKEEYPEIFDIMVNYKEGYNTDYTYFSDAGRKFKLIFDPINNDVINSDDKNVSFNNLNELLPYLKLGNCIISTHPHRWMNSPVKYVLKAIFFKGVKLVAKIVMKIPFFKKIMSKYYYLAKKI